MLALVGEAYGGAGGIARYGGLMAAGQLFWFVQSQADVFIAGRLFDPHWLASIPPACS